MSVTSSQLQLSRQRRQQWQWQRQLLLPTPKLPKNQCPRKVSPFPSETGEIWRGKICQDKGRVGGWGERGRKSKLKTESKQSNEQSNLSGVGQWQTTLDLGVVVGVKPEQEACMEMQVLGLAVSIDSSSG